ncbi:selectin P ligand [Phyllostomus discolor]|uniref:P-selectin glycoprotein ligand 1 isoform X1 n=1 Tax=Phyllostomus discolor TaxID=89673 RepID=A0A6J2MYA9_9CHIR|nr:P-selectin glycoprotein ligand 1 isoform X1 [Phyllostomus discolor]XP_035869679.1 P-selectin glycoprotein ligand 1 isoform X1 [Phyllostomus discolor]KAF6082885.1 selectin P ligand [Phyllostomus discolor]
MPLQVLLLLTLLGPGSSFQPWDTWEDVAKQAPGHLFARARRQVDPGDDDFDMYDVSYNTDPPEMLGNDDAEAVTPSPNLQAVTGLPGQGDTAGPGTPEPATLGGARGESAGPDAGGATIGDLGTEFVTVGIPITPVFLPQKLVTSIPPIMEASSTQGAPPTELASVSALFMGPAATEAATTQPEATEALSTEPTVIEALSTEPTVMEALSTEPSVMEALSTQPVATEALTTQPVATEALTTQPVATEALTTTLAAMEALSTALAATEAPDTEAPSTEPAATETLPKDPATMKAPSTQPATPRDLTTAHPVPSDPPGGTAVAVSTSSGGSIKQQELSQALSPRSPVSSSPAGGLDYIPVKHCLLAILVLALVATTFLVCTVVLAVRLSRKNHMYPVRNYSPTEMVCISALLPEGEEGPAVTANGSLPAAKKPGRREGSGEDREGDDLTLHSFLP